MRSFAAIALPEEQRTALADLTRELRATRARASWVRPDNLHLTLCFLGEVTEEQTRAVAEEMRPKVADVAPFNATPHGVGCFPNARRPSVIWVGLKAGEASLESLSAIARAAAVSAGVTLDKKPFLPHVTLGRVRDRQRMGTLTGVLPHLTDFAAAPFVVREVTLYESVLGRGGPRYRVLARLPLA